MVGVTVGVAVTTGIWVSAVGVVALTIGTWTSADGVVTGAHEGSKSIEDSSKRKSKRIGKTFITALYVRVKIRFRHTLGRACEILKDLD